LQAGGGSGIGLFVSKGIMDQPGGFVGVRSHGLGRGCTFFVDVPLDLVKPSHSGTEPRQHPITLATEPRQLWKSVSLQGSSDEGMADVTNDSSKFQMTSVSLQGSSSTDFVTGAATDFSGDNANESKKQEAVKPKWEHGATMDRPLRVMVVDDSASSRKMVKRFLLMARLCSPDIAEAADGAEAVRLVQESLQHASGNGIGLLSPQVSNSERRLPSNDRFDIILVGVAISISFSLGA
jgi:CheY-like chemotaxis protein